MNTTGLASILAILLPLTSCAAPDAAPSSGQELRPFRTWGTLREALRDGKTQARIKLDAINSPHLVAVGAAAGLDGEITIIDGDSFTSRVRGQRIETTASTAIDATILFAAEVTEWRTVPIPADLDGPQLEALVVEQARSGGIDTEQPFAFVVEGELLDLELHVLAGECPIRARLLDTEMKSPPQQRRFDKVRGRLVGIHASHGGGVITHHGSTTHIHAVVGGEAAFTGHCERAGVGAGATLRLPAATSPASAGP